MASIKKDKTGKWRYRVSYKGEDGKYHQKTKRGFRTKADAQYEANRVEQALKEGVDIQVASMPFADYFQKWAETYKIGHYSDTTDEKYEREIRYVRKYFKSTPLNKVTKTQVQGYLNMRGKGNGKDTVQKAYGRLHSCFLTARADGLVNRDPTYKVTINYESEGRGAVKYYSLAEAEKLAQYYSDHQENPAYLMLYVALQTGLRIGEIYGLAYEDVTPESLSVKRGYDHTRHHFTKGKTASAIRTIASTKDIYQRVLKHKMMHQAVNPTYIFLNEKNRPLQSYNIVKKYNDRACKECGIERHSIHALRHTHCSILLYKGVDLQYISKRLGHASISETLKTYSHMIDEMNQREEEKVIDILNDLSV